ncbi:MAG: DUF6364 family protein [Bacteroidota bacterium]
MDAKITLSFDEDVINKAKKYAEENNISLSRLTEFLLRKVTSGHHSALEDFPISDWVSAVSEGEVEYQRQPKGSNKHNAEYFKNKK